MLAGEVRRFAAEGVETGRGVVRFAGTVEDVMHANLHLRSAMRVLLAVTAGPVAGRDDLYALCAAVPWEDLLSPEQSLMVEVAGRTPAFASGGFAALVVKDAVVDRMRARRGRRPSVDRSNPEVRIHLHLSEDAAEVALDGSGEPLNRRGYRPRGGPAPLAETLAAGMLLLAGYDGGMPFLDPMCGTGTLAIEAALIAAGIAPGKGRAFACERWRFASQDAFRRAREEAAALRRDPAAPVVARDADPRAVAAARRNAEAAGVADVLRVERGDVADLRVAGPGWLLVTNPPYGHRLGAPEELGVLYRAMGDALKRGAQGCTAWLLVGEPGLAKQVGLRASRRIVLFNGPIECRLLRYDLFEGPMRPREGPKPS